jgi:hypothetical protein
MMMMRAVRHAPCTVQPWNLDSRFKYRNKRPRFGYSALQDELVRDPLVWRYCCGPRNERLGGCRRSYLWRSKGWTFPAGEGWVSIHRFASVRAAVFSAAGRGPTPPTLYVSLFYRKVRRMSATRATSYRR